MNNIKKDFPFFIHHPKLVYLDNAATTQKPQAVIDTISHFYAYENAPVHRGIYQLAEKATTHYEKVREQVAAHLNAQDSSEIIFTKGTTESINLVAQAWAAHYLQAGDEIILSQLEHHANMVPWLYLAQQKKLVIKWIPVVNGLLDSVAAQQLFSTQTKLLAISNNSNIFGYELDIFPLIAQAKKVGARILIDAAQSVSRSTIDVQKLGCDFLAFSGHKMLGPTGVGVLYINKAAHDQIYPYQLGGSMVYEVSFEKAQWRPMPYRLEAGTPPIAQVIGLGAALTYVRNTLDFQQLRLYEAALCAQFLEGIKQIPCIQIIGNENTLKKSGHSVSFTVEGMHPHDVAAFLDNYGICVRAGHHCAQPMHQLLQLTGSVRASFYCYTTHEDIEQLITVLNKLT
ncbi:MAG: cysteine desulfurase [Candidatus Babeliaceae bacterium]